MLDGLVEQARADVLIWPYFPVDAREYGWLQSWLAGRLSPSGSGNILTTRLHERAVLDSRADKNRTHSDGIELSSKNRSNLRRQMRRLAEEGEVRFVSTLSGFDQQLAFEHFIKVEASGWKGRMGTAIDSDPNLRAFVEGFLPQLMDEGRAQIDLMMLGQSCIAANVVLRAGRGLFAWKIGIDEDYKRYSPGMHLAMEFTRFAMENPKIDYVDSLADADHPMANHIWSARRALALLFVPLSSFGQVASHSLKAGFEGKERARYWAKRALGRG